MLERVLHMESRTNKMNWISKVIWLYLFLSPFFDVITSFSIHYLSKSMPVILGIKFLFLIFLLFLNFHYRDRKSIFYSFLMGIYFVCFFLLMWKEKGTGSFFLEAQNLFRTFYFPFVFLFLFSLQKRGIFQIQSRYFSYILYIYLFFLIIPHLLHLDFSSYAYSKEGSLGWFYSTNEIGGILALLGPFLLSYLATQKWIVRIFSFAFYVCGILVIGTKVPILAFLITIFLFFVRFVWRLYKKREWKKIIGTMGVALVSVIGFSLVLLNSSFYQNIKIHLEFLEIHELSDLFTFHHIDHFIFSERLSFLQSTNEVYANSTFMNKCLGIGIVEFQENEPISQKMIEMDYFDIFYHYGIIGTLLFFLPFFLVPLRRKYLFEEKISILLAFLLALFSGHILVSPSVSVLVASVFIPKEEER